MLWQNSPASSFCSRLDCPFAQKPFSSIQRVGDIRATVAETCSASPNVHKITFFSGSCPVNLSHTWRRSFHRSERATEGEGHGS
jgi:hypothetical protein